MESPGEQIRTFLIPSHFSSRQEGRLEEVETYSQQVINPSICYLLMFFASEELRAFACRHWGAQQLPWASLAEPTAAFPGQLGCLGYNVGTPHSCQGLPLYMPPLAGHKKNLEALAYDSIVSFQTGLVFSTCCLVWLRALRSLSAPGERLMFNDRYPSSGLQWPAKPDTWQDASSMVSLVLRCPYLLLLCSFS